LLAVFLVLGMVYAIMTPLFEISDELWHYPMVKTLADGQGLPVQDPARPGPWRQEGSQPPLYYVLMALATRWIDTSDMTVVRWINPHADNGVITPDGNNNIIIHTYREGWPWYGTVLAVRLIRFASVVMGAGTVYFTYRLAQEVVPGRDGLALAAAGFTAFTPMFVFISGSVNNDNLTILLSTASLWLMARWLRGPAPQRAREFVLMGLLLGAAVLSKVSALGLWPLAGAVLLWTQFQPWLDRRRSSAAPLASPTRPYSVLRLASRPVLIVYGTALIASGWWFVRNYLLYRDWLGWSAFLDMVGRRPHPATLAQLWGERVGFVQAYWGLFGGVSVPMPLWTYTLLNAVVLLALLGLAWGLIRYWRVHRRLDLADAAAWGLIVLWLSMIVVGLMRWTSLTWASQGRLIFPAIGAIGVLVAVGLARLWRGLPWVALTFMAGLTTVTPFTVIIPHYRPPPQLTADQLAHLPPWINGTAGADFGGEMKLLGYRLENATAVPGQAVRLTLYWQAEIAMDRNWSIFVHVVDDQGVIVAQRDRYPGMGAFATTQLKPGQTFADDYVIPIPPVTYAPTAARIEVGLYDLMDGTRLTLSGVSGGGDALRLAPLMIAARPIYSVPGIGQVPNPIQLNFANRIELTGYSLDRRSPAPGQDLRLALYWRAIGPISANYSVFAHVRGMGETLWAGQDSWPQQGAAPTSTWRLGAVVVDPHQLTLKPDTPSGQYALEVGVYDATTGKRLQVIEADGRPTDADFVNLSQIRVAAP
jgi:4-amino-4-deoxy-L-arabinose transferase-like glycosyltransferase